MLLPCPHCRRQFNLNAEKIPAVRARLKCPACEGVFVVNLTASSKEAADGPVLMDSRLRGNDGLAEAQAALATATAGRALDRERPRFLMFWTLVPAICLLLALVGILLSGPWATHTTPPLSPSRTEISAQEEPSSAKAVLPSSKEALSSSVSSLPDASPGQASPKQEPAAPISLPTRPAENLMALAFWSPGSDPKAICNVLQNSQARFLQTEDQDICRIYPLWITYLILDTEPTPVCDLEPTFACTSDGLQEENLCGPGHAFLSAYYLKKGLLDRSQSFLDQALGLAPDDPWVRMVEAVFFGQAYYDDQKAIHILEDLSQKHPSLCLARYLLGKAHVREEQYSEANAAFASLKEDVKGQIAFWRIRRALASLELAADEGEGNAEPLLALSRAFNSLKDYTMAQDLYRWILQEIPEELPKGEQTAAYCELAGIYEKRGDHGSAYKAYQNALEIDPNFQAAREGIDALLASQPDHS